VKRKKHDKKIKIKKEERKFLPQEEQRG